MKNQLLYGWYGLLAVLFVSCTTIQPVSIGGIESVSVKTFNRQGLEADFGIKIKNPNNVSVTVFPSDFHATINGVDAGILQLNKQVNIKANSDDISEFHVKTDFSKFDLASIITLLASKRADVNLKGTIRAGRWYYKKNFPVEFNKRISFDK